MATSLVSFPTQGGRESCLKGGSERVLILGGLCPAMLRAASINCPFMEPLKESPVWGPWLLKLRSQRRGGEVGRRAFACRLLYTWQSYEISQGLGEETNICACSVPAILFPLSYSQQLSCLLTREAKEAQRKDFPKFTQLEAEPGCGAGRSLLLTSFSLDFFLSHRGIPHNFLSLRK